MSELDRLYAKLAELGFSVLRLAIQSGDRAWMEAEVEALHNVPSLIGEENVERHRHYWFSERPHYIDWISTNAPPDAVRHKEILYDNLWAEMEPLVIEMIVQHDEAAQAQAK